MKQRKHNGFRRMLAVLFAVAMVVTSVPQTAMTAYAAETDSTEETIVETVDVSEEELVTVEEGTEKSEGQSSEAEDPAEETTEEETVLEEIVTEEIVSEVIEETVVETVEQTDVKTDGESGDGTGTESEVYTFTFAPDEHVTVYDADGVNEITELTVPVGSSDQVDFMIKVDTGYTIKSVRSDLKTSYLRVSGSWKTGIYYIQPGKLATDGCYTSGATITVTSAVIADYTATFSYNADAVELETLKDEETVVLTDGALTISNTESLSFELKPKDGYKISNVTYTTGTGEDAYTDTLTGYDDDEDGYYEYSVGRLFEDHVITIAVSECCQITFNTENAGINLWNYYADEESGEGWFEEYGSVANGLLKWAKNEPVYFSIGTSAERYRTLVSTTEDESGRLTPFGYLDHGAVYKIIPTEDMSITAKVLPALFPLVYDESFVEDIKISYDSYESEDFPVTLSEDKKSIEIFKDVSFILYVKPKSGKKIYSMYSTYAEWGEDEEGNYVETGTYKEHVGFELNEEGYYYAAFSTGGDVKDVGVEEGCTITFNSPKATVVGNYTGDVIEKSTTWAVGETFIFEVTPVDRYEVVYVTTSGDESGKIDPFTVEDEELGESYTYYKVTPTEDMTISVVTEAANKQITFVNECTSMSYAVTSELLDSNGDYCYINKNAETFTFNVIANDANAQPNVMLRDNKGNDTILQGTESRDESGSCVYSYTVDKSVMTDEMTIYISDENVPKKLTVVYDNNVAPSVVVTVDDLEISPDSTSIEDSVCTAVYAVEKGKTAVLSVNSGERYSISSVVVNKGNDLAAEVHEVGSSSYSSTITMDVNTRVNINTKGKIFTTVKLLHGDGGETELEAIGNRYVATPGKTYKVNIEYGSQPLELASVSTGEIYTDEAGSFWFTIPEDASWNYYVKYDGTYVENGRSYTISRSVVFNITDEVDTVRVSYARDEVVVDTKAWYKYTSVPNSASLANAGVEITLKEGVPEGSVSYKWNPGLKNGGNLQVWASARAGLGEVATIRLYRKGVLPTAENYYIEGSEVKLTILEPTALLESKPEVKVTAVDDASMTLKLDTPYENGCVNGKQYYKIDVVPQAVDGKEIPASIVEATAKPFFIAREYPEYDDDGEEIPGFIQTAKLIINSAGLGAGQNWKYDVKVTLVQTYDKTELTAENAAEKIAYSSQTLDLGEVATKDPAFAVKLTLQKKASQIYTTQKNVVAANLKYDKYAVCADATAADITACEETEKLSVRVENGQLLVSASSNTKLGKHTIQVTPYGPETLYRQNVSMTVNVVKGIEKIQISVPSNTIYKQANKAANLTASIIYNGGSTTPKTKKVKWEIVDETGMALDEFHALNGLVTIKNGKVTVNKKADVSEASQTFRIKATAADFAGNTTTAMSETITVSSQFLQLGEMVIVQKNDATSVYTVVAQNGSTVPTVTTDKLRNAQLVVLKSDETVKSYYTEEELDAAKISASQLTVKSSAAKSIALSKDGDDVLIASGKPAKNIKLTVTTNDGGKKSAVMKVTVAYTTPEALTLGIYEGNNALNDPASDNLNVSFDGTVNTKLTLKVMQKTGEADWDEVYAYTNHAVKISGGKILSSDIEKGKYTVLVSKDKATITLTDKVNKVSKKYIVSNTNYSKGKAPAVKIKKNTSKNIVCGVLPDRSLEYQITSKNYSCTDKYVMIETEAVSAAKKTADYAAFAAACDKIGVYTPVSDGSLKLNFTNTNIPIGSYKLTMTFGTMTDGKFSSDAKPVNVTVKVVKAKVTKGSYKAASTYKNVQAVSGNIISLTGKEKNVHSITYTNVMGANVKGAENKFLEYFRLEDNKLIIREDLTAEQLAALKNSKTDNSGYLTYTVEFGDNGYGVPYTETKTVKITVKFKK